MKTTTTMIKKLWIWLFVLFLVAVYGYVIYQLITFQYYDTLLERMSHLTIKKIAALVLVLLLSPCAAFVEAHRWQVAMRGTSHLTLREALVHILNGWAAALITPFRAGEIPARALSAEAGSRWQALTNATLCSLVQTLVIISIGIWPAILWGQLSVADTRYYFIAWIGVIVLWLAFRPLCQLIYQSTKIAFLKKICEAGVFTTWSNYLRTLALTLIRYSIFCAQLFMMIRFMGVGITIEDAFIFIPTYYLLITLTPGAAIADAGIRGAWAALIFAPLTTTPQLCIIAAVALWMINNFIPLIALPWLKK